MKVISSRDNPQLKMWKKIVDSSKAIRDFGYCILSGPKLVEEALKLAHIEVRAEIISDDLRPLGATDCYRLPKALFNQLDILGTGFNLLVIKPPKIEPWSESDPINGIEVICPLGDPKNLGSLARSCVAFGVTSIILTEEACYPFLPAALKAASLASLQIEFKQGPRLSQLKGPLVALDLNGTPLPGYQRQKPFRFLVGQEGQGLKELSANTLIERVSIPTRKVESLNATVAASLALYHFYQNE